MLCGQLDEITGKTFVFIATLFFEKLAASQHAGGRKPADCSCPRRLPAGCLSRVGNSPRSPVCCGARDAAPAPACGAHRTTTGARPWPRPLGSPRAIARFVAYSSRSESSIPRSGVNMLCAHLRRIPCQTTSEPPRHGPTPHREIQSSLLARCPSPRLNMEKLLALASGNSRINRPEIPARATMRQIARGESQDSTAVCVALERWLASQPGLRTIAVFRRAAGRSRSIGTRRPASGPPLGLSARRRRPPHISRRGKSSRRTDVRRFWHPRTHPRIGNPAHANRRFPVPGHRLRPPRRTPRPRPRIL